MTAIVAMQELARRLGQDAALRARAHEISAESHRKRGAILGVIEIAMSAAIGATIVGAAMGAGSASSVLYLGLGFIVILQPLLAKLNSYLNNPMQIERHTRSSAAYYAFNRMIALQLVDPELATPDKLRRLVDKVNREFAEVSATGLPLSAKVLRVARLRLTEDARAERPTESGLIAAADAQPSPGDKRSLKRLASVVALPLLATTVIPYIIVSPALSAQGKIAAIAVAFALGLVLVSSWRLTADPSAAAAAPWPTLLSRIGKPMTAGVVLILASEMLLVLTGEMQQVSDPWQRVHAFTGEWSAWIKAGLLCIYAVIVTYLISRQESLWKVERGMGLAHRAEVTVKGHL